jgi:hypothetical protein
MALTNGEHRTVFIFENLRNMDTQENVAVYVQFGRGFTDRLVGIF